MNFADRLIELVTSELGVTHCDLAEAVLISAQFHTSPMHALWAAGGNREWRARRHTCATVASTLLDDWAVAEEPTAELVRQLGQWVDARMATPNADHGIALLALADALDGRYGHLFLEHFRARSALAGDAGVRIAPGRAVPRFPLIGAAGSRGLTTEPGKVNPPFDFTERLKLSAVTNSLLEIRLRVPAVTAVGALKRGLRLALVEPSHDMMADFVRPEGPGDGKFFGVEPSDEVGFTRHLVELFERAKEGGANVVLFPELCLTEKSLEVLECAFAASPGTVCIFIPGSLHRRVGDQRVNEAPALVRGPGPIFTQRKRQAFETDVPNDGPKCEALTPAPPIQWIGVLPGLTFSVVICRDALNTDTIDTLADLHLNLVLVPALSAKVNQFKLTLSPIVAQGQGIAAVAVTPIKNGTPRGIVLLPDERNPIREWPPGVEDVWFLDATPPYDGQ